MSKCWYCNEELTTANYCDEHIGICTKCYCSMFQVSNEFVKGLMDKIADLEAKLALTEKTLELIAKSVLSDGTSCMKFLDTGIQVNSQVEYLEYFKSKAKEMKDE